MRTLELRARGLSRAEAAQLQRAYRTDGDLCARKRLIEAYLPLVRSLARRFAGSGEGFEDLVQVGSIGLIKAVDRFEPARGVELGALAVPTILGEIKRHLRDRSSPVRVPRRHQAVNHRIQKARAALSTRLQRDPTLREVAHEAQLDERDVTNALRAEHARKPLPLAEASGVLSVDGAFAASEDRVAIARSMRSLHHRERAAVQYRYFADLSQDEVAACLGISQTQTSRLLASGLAKLRANLESGTPFSSSTEVNSWHGDPRRRHGRAA